MSMRPMSKMPGRMKSHLSYKEPSRSKSREPARRKDCTHGLTVLPSLLCHPQDFDKSSMTIIVTALARLEYQCPDLCDRIAGRVQRNPGQWELTQLVSIVDSFAKLKYDNPVSNIMLLWSDLGDWSLS